MKDDYTTNSQYLTYAFLLISVWGECTFWAWEWRGCTLLSSAGHVRTSSSHGIPAYRLPCAIHDIARTLVPCISDLLDFSLSLSSAAFGLARLRQSKRALRENTHLAWCHWFPWPEVVLAIRQFSTCRMYGQNPQYNKSGRPITALLASRRLGEYFRTWMIWCYRVCFIAHTFQLTTVDCFSDANLHTSPAGLWISVVKCDIILQFFAFKPRNHIIQCT